MPKRSLNVSSWRCTVRKSRFFELRNERRQAFNGLFAGQRMQAGTLQGGLELRH